MVCSELHTKIGKREETVCIVETLLVFTVAALHFAVVMWRVWADQFVPDPKARSGQFNASKPVFLVSREMVGKLNTIPYTTAFEPGYHFLQKIGGGIGTLLRVSPKIAKTCIALREITHESKHFYRSDLDTFRSYPQRRCFSIYLGFGLSFL